MKPVSRNHSHANIDHKSLSHKTVNFHRVAFSFENCQLRKSIFNPYPGLPETYAARRHLAGTEVPKVEIVHYSPRWLLLQSPKVKADFFDKVNRGKLGCRE
jgi:hypothetical protein